MHRHLRIIARDSGAPAQLFEDAPPRGIQRLLGLLRAGNPNVRGRALLVVLLAWLPLVLLTSADTGGIGAVTVGMHARYLIAAPLFVLAESVCAKRLTAITWHFLSGGLLPEDERDHFDRILSLVSRLLSSRVAEVGAWLAAYSCAALLVWPAGGAHRFSSWSAVNWWQAGVSLPLLLVLLFGWAWRLAIWTLALVWISRLDLLLVASHPDHAAGLGFVGDSLRAFAIVALALSTILAGQSARLVIDQHALTSANIQFDLAVLACIATALILPLLAFVPKLARTFRRGLVQYGELATGIGRAFEAKWLTDRTILPRETALDTPDFSTTTDLYQVVSNVYGMRFLPASARDVIVLVGALMVPFLPQVLFVTPPEVLWEKLRALLP